MPKAFEMQPLKVNQITFVSPRKPGEFKTDSGEVIEYGWAAKFLCRDTQSVFDEEVGIDVTREVEIEVPISCADKTEMLAVIAKLEEMKKAHTSFDVPFRSFDGRTVRPYFNGKKFLEDFASFEKVNTKAAS